MVSSRLSRSSTAWFLALGLMVAGSTPVLLTTLLATRATAQQFPGSLQRDRVTAGTLIPVEYEDAEKIVVTPDETVEVTVLSAQSLRTSTGRVWLPAGSQIRGEIRPVGSGSQFIAREVIFSNGRSFRLNANSDVVSRTETIKKGASAGDILKGAAVGAAAAT
ncbi:MAG: hypothetical protein HC825_02950, partial [Oscillatoriales cyanobacterium RM1_1_9]|nr:hypothetical protein [Oscillatoriales cyanobacterium RM1_1_9]